MLLSHVMASRTPELYPFGVRTRVLYTAIRHAPYSLVHDFHCFRALGFDNLLTGNSIDFRISKNVR
jgi:hypothetical protein